MDTTILDMKAVGTQRKPRERVRAALDRQPCDRLPIRADRFAAGDEFESILVDVVRRVSEA